jgi:hypothetical protein
MSIVTNFVVKLSMRWLSILILVAAAIVAPMTADADVSVRGYFRSNGTYVAPHFRSSPNGSYNDNWSVRGNINPYTGEAGTRAPTWNDRPPQSGDMGGGTDAVNSYGLGFGATPMNPDAGRSLKDNTEKQLKAQRETSNYLQRVCREYINRIELHVWAEGAPEECLSAMQTYKDENSGLFDPDLRPVFRAACQIIGQRTPNCSAAHCTYDIPDGHLIKTYVTFIEAHPERRGENYNLTLAAAMKQGYPCQ